MKNVAILLLILLGIAIITAVCAWYKEIYKPRKRSDSDIFIS
jgi:hypothetical protein